jgi:hypothetical protein
MKFIKLFFFEVPETFISKIPQVSELLLKFFEKFLAACEEFPTPR